MLQQQQGDGSSYSSALLAAAELITMSRMNDLRSKEKELLNEIQSLNKQLQTNKDNQVKYNLYFYFLYSFPFFPLSLHFSNGRSLVIHWI